jgi:DNA-directed RNA polymerase beta' subunit
MFVSEIRKWLKIICLECGSILIPDNKLLLIPLSERFTKLSTLAQKIGCHLCGAKYQRIIKSDEDNFTTLIDDGKVKIKLFPGKIKQIFNRVTNETVIKLNKSYHPSVLVINNIPIASNTVRPVGGRMVYQSGGSTDVQYHDLTNLTQRLAKQLLDLSIDSNTTIIQDSKEEMHIQNIQQLWYDMIIGKNTQNVKSNTGKRGIVIGGKKISPISEEWTSKHGLIRSELLGGFTLSIARSTISGNPNLKLSELGVPLEFAKIMSISETVQSFNIDKLMVYFVNGTKKYPGCISIIKRNTKTEYKINDQTINNLTLEYGDIINRNIINGDILCFTREPALERTAMCAFKVRITNNNTFSFNVIDCALNGSDFDGDAMNGMAPHGPMTRVETGILSTVPNFLISTKNSRIALGQTQDSVIGSAKLSRCSKINKYHAMMLFSKAGIEIPDFGSYNNTDILTGGDIISALFKNTPFNYSKAPSWYNEALSPFINYLPENIKTVFQNGKFMSGVLDSKSISEGAEGGIFHLIAYKYGNEIALEQMFTLQQLALTFLDCVGFSSGIDNMLIPASKLNEINNIVLGMLTDVEQINKRLERGELIPPIGLTTIEYYEHLVKEALRTPDEVLKPIISSLDVDNNGLYNMIGYKSKGSLPNLIHISGFIGQTEINGSRIKNNYGFARANPWFPRFDLDPEPNGFNSNCYINGINSNEVLNSGQGGRYDLITKALATAQTGTSARHQTRCMETNITDNYRRSVIGNQIIQLLYGGDGVDTRKLINVTLHTVKLSDEELKTKYYLNLSDSTKADQKIFDDEFKQIKSDRDKFRQSIISIESTGFNDVGTNIRHVPVDVEQMVNDIIVKKMLSGSSQNKKSAKELIRMHDMVNSACKNLPYILINEIQEQLQSKIPEYIECAVFITQMLIRTELCSLKLLKLNEEDLIYIIDTIKLYYAIALIDYGVSIGILAAQSISEPMTQYMLDSHHRSVGGGTTRAGILKPKEILGAKSKSSEMSPEMLLRVLPQYEHDHVEVSKIADQIEYMDLKRFIYSWSLLDERFNELVYPPFLSDRSWIDNFIKFYPLLRVPTNITKWCIRLQLDKPSMILDSMSLDYIIEKLRIKYQNMYIIHNSENDTNVIIRMYLLEPLIVELSRNDINIITKITNFINHTLFNTQIRGINGIISAAVEEIQRNFINEDGSLEVKTIFAIRTSGTNLEDITLVPQIDPYTTVSSSIDDTYGFLGIVAARNVIIRELDRFMGGKSPNIRHLSLYADEMTCTGKVTALIPSGIDVREKINVFLRMGANKPVVVIRKAAIDNVTTKLNGLSANYIMGRPPSIGTLYNEFQYDEAYISKNHNNITDVFDDLE